ncbi:O-antigen ligase family protein [Acinetobacter dispersus]|uniref:O-antigen ligase family protein n=2 Tax=Acinetobacter dispersus TaxID=70348 RepID=UPI001F4B3AC9|nr:O-antigen ligase family protein [Acinetobacter dispersus]MCH7384505.1 O-antigen ligase family protein [Acinetobacter dispersus]
MLYLITTYLLMFNLGVNLNYLQNIYDEYRLFEILISFICIFLVLKSNINFSKSTLLFFIVIFVFLVFNLNFFNIFSLQDILLWMVSFFIFLALLEVDFEKRKNLYPLLIFVLISVLPIFFIFLSIFNFLYEGKWYSWQFYSGSIRIFDSYIVTVFWLSLFLFKKKFFIVSKIYFYIIFLIFLALLFNGARSALISIIFPLSILWFVDKENRYLVHKSFFALGSALFLYKLIYIIRNYIHANDLNSNVYRLSTSFRYEMWMFMFEKWKITPFLGLNGGFLADIQYQYGSHAHNIWLRLIFEWGGVGIILVLFFLYQLYILFKSKIDPIIKMGVIAIIIDSNFSGNFIYPASQVSCILFLALAFSYIKREFNINNTLSKALLLLYMLLFFYIVMNYFLGDLSCVGCENIEGRAAPFFWENGGSKHLQKSD